MLVLVVDLTHQNPSKGLNIWFIFSMGSKFWNVYKESLNLNEYVKITYNYSWRSYASIQFELVKCLKI